MAVCLFGWPNNASRFATFFLSAMSDLSSLLLASLNPATRKSAELNLNALSIQPGFLSHLLGLILDPTKERSVRLAGSVFLKNIAKGRWEEVILSFHSVSEYSNPTRMSTRSQRQTRPLFAQGLCRP